MNYIERWTVWNGHGNAHHRPDRTIYSVELFFNIILSHHTWLSRQDQVTIRLHAFVRGVHGVNKSSLLSLWQFMIVISKTGDGRCVRSV